MYTTADLRNVVSFYADTEYDAAYLATNTTRLDNICRRVVNGSVSDFEELLNRALIELFAADRARFAAESLDAATTYGATRYDADYVTVNSGRLRGLCERTAFGTPNRVSTLEEMRNRLMIHLLSHRAAQPA